jgi:chromate transporter
LGGSALKTRALTVLGAAAVALNLLGVNELLVLFGSGLVMALTVTRRNELPLAVLLPGGLQGSVLAGAATTAAAVAAVPFSLGSLFLFFLKVGSVLFGSGYVLLAFLRADLVERWHWLTEAQLLDAIAVGQITPGPLFTTATFIGYLLGGGTGAVIATVGIFLPAFFFVAVSGPLVPRLRRSRVAGAFLDGVNVASLALMAVVTGQLAWSSLIDVPSFVLLAAAGIALFRFQINATWLVLGGAGAGMLLSLVRGGT